MYSCVEIKTYARDLLELLKKDAFRQEEITLSSGAKSSYYIDARMVTLNPRGAFLAACLIVNEILKLKDICAVGGPTMGADPLVGAIGFLSFEKNIPLKTFIVRKTPKAHGMKKRTEGPDLPKAGRVVLIDDVATSGGSLIDSADALKIQGIQIAKALVLVDRKQGAAENLAKEGIAFGALFSIDDILENGL